MGLAKILLLDRAVTAHGLLLQGEAASGLAAVRGGQPCTAPTRFPGNVRDVYKLGHNQASSASLERPAMAPRVRLIWLVVLFAAQFLYFPINRTVQGGVVLATPWDDLFPLWPVWVIPYLLTLVWWTGCFVWAAWKMEDDLYRAFVISMVSVMLASYLVYIVYPTYVIRPSPQGDGWLSRLVALLYEGDRVNNAFPSGHTYNTVMIALYWWRWMPRQRWLWLAITIVVLLSTLFTRQHNLPDLIGGLVFAWLGYRFGLWWVARSSRGG